jgi:signal transduction histidine kinase
MKLKSLYVKILLAFAGVLFVTEILILALFIGTAGRTFKKHIDRQSVAKLVVFRNSVSEKLADAPELALADNRELAQYLSTFARLFDLTIWMTGPDNDVVFNSGAIPDESALNLRRGSRTDQEGIRLYHLSRRHFSYYAAIRMRHQDQPFTLHLYLNREHEKKPEAVFFVGLLVIGGVIALLIIPLTRFITRRIAQVNESALDFAGGNLKRRAKVEGKDEIAELAGSFNFMADKLEKMIRGNREMMANISHELRSPLARIRMSKELIRDRVDLLADVDIKRYADHIDQDIDALDNLIDQILKLSKMDFEEGEDHREVLMLEPFFDEIASRFEPVLKGNNLTIKKSIGKEVCVVWDRQALDIVLSNLLDNAAKYTDPGSRIMVEAKKAAGCVQFSIANPSTSIGESELEQLFKPFFRGDKTVSGAGIGLAIVKKLVEKNNASIAARTENGSLIFELEFKTG